jgi:hypothetical protein
MKISFDAFAFLVFIIGAPLIMAGMLIDDLIVQHVCRREGRKYSISWPLSPYWQWRIFKPAWFKEAKDGGYFKVRVAIVAAWLCCLAAAIILKAGGFIDFGPRRVQ